MFGVHIQVHAQVSCSRPELQVVCRQWPVTINAKNLEDGVPAGQQGNQDCFTVCTHQQLMLTVTRTLKLKTKYPITLKRRQDPSRLSDTLQSRQMLLYKQSKS